MPEDDAPRADELVAAVLATRADPLVSADQFIELVALLLAEVRRDETRKVIHAAGHAISFAQTQRLLVRLAEIDDEKTKGKS